VKLLCIGAASLALLTAVAASAMADDCTLKQVASLEMADRFPGRVVVTASVNGSPHSFMVDTGGLVTQLYDDVVQKLGLSTSTINPNVEIYDTSGNVSRRYVRVDNFALGPAHADNKVMVVKPRGPGEDLGIDGVIGPDVLEHFDVELDFADRKFNLISQDHCEGRVVYWAKSYTDADFTLSDDHVVIPMMLDGREVTATLDTGAPGTYLSEAAAHRLFGIDTTSPGMERDPDAPPQSPYAYRYKFKSLSVGGLAVSNPLIGILPDLARQAFNRRHNDKEDFDPVTATQLRETPVLLGMDVLSKLHLYIAYKERKLYITSAGAH
jgi:predicted aspartyl protease